ncbi:MAG: tetratricopeptide repeat protein [Candidatus Coatesbacteria bacterium]|nr:MAG: tetratricopeptide repeat protein [Candidatus Coatesbacteria bacterium]
MAKEEGYTLPQALADDFDEAVETMELGGDQEGPREVFERLLESEPDHPRLLLALGLTYFHEQRYEEAENIFLKAFELYPDFSLVYSHLSFVYSWTGRCEEAAEYAEKAIKLDPESPVNWNAMGLRYGHDGNYEMALGHFLAAYALDPNYYLSSFNVACTYAVLGDTEKALEFLKTALRSRRFVHFAEIDPDLASVRTMREFKALLSEAWKRLGVN